MGRACVVAGPRLARQGTAEYVGMVVMVTCLVAAVAVAAEGWAPDIGNALKKALTGAVNHLTDGFG